jgi:hypothetical protein
VAAIDDFTHEQIAEITRMAWPLREALPRRRPPIVGGTAGRLFTGLAQAVAMIS